MTKYLTAYLAWIDRLLAENDAETLEKLKDEHLKQISFMQHERFIHLIVMSLFAVLLFISIGILCYTGKLTYGLLTILLLALLIPYVFHYYFLENSVQRMYRQYNLMAGSDKYPDECKYSGTEMKR